LENIVLAIGVYFLFIQDDTTNTNNANTIINTNTVVNENVNTVTNINSTNGNIKIYSNDNVNIQFEYPSNMKIDEVLNTPEEIHGLINYDYQITLTNSETEINISTTSLCSGTDKILSDTEIQVDDYLFNKLVFKTATDSNEICYNPKLLDLDKGLFDGFTIRGNADSDAQISIINNIVSSIKIIN